MKRREGLEIWHRNENAAEQINYIKDRLRRRPSKQLKNKNRWRFFVFKDKESVVLDKQVVDVAEAYRWARVGWWV